MWDDGNWYIYLCWRKLSWRLKYFPHTSQAYVNSGLLWVRSCIIKLYGLVKRRWQNLHTNSHFGRILRRKSLRRSSLSIRITANILADVEKKFWLWNSLALFYTLSVIFGYFFFFPCDGFIAILRHTIHTSDTSLKLEQKIFLINAENKFLFVFLTVVESYSVKRKRKGVKIVCFLSKLL